MTNLMYFSLVTVIINFQTFVSLQVFIICLYKFPLHLKNSSTLLIIFWQAFVRYCLFRSKI